MGAGVAGLAAAARLRRAGVGTTVIEAGDRVGGRAYTASVQGAVFDHGAAWLHDAARNPLVALARPGDGLFDSDARRTERTSIDGRSPTPAELAEEQAAWDWTDALARQAPHRPDTTLAAALEPLDSAWHGLVALWEGEIIAAASAGRLGLHDWARNRLGGWNAMPPEGVGAYVARRLATAVRLRTPATAVIWDGPGVRVETPHGTLAADAAIITVSTGVLAAGAIRFEPPLPGAVRAAIAALPMGLLSKVVLPCATRLGLAADTSIADRGGRMSFNAWPQGRAHLVGYLGGDLAWGVSAAPDDAVDLARAELARALGADALGVDALRGLGGGAVVTGWGEDALFRGAYAYAGPGDSGQRGVLGAAFPGERLLFAGEATRMDGLAGTVGGAWLSGVAAAERLIAVPGAGRAGSP